MTVLAGQIITADDLNGPIESLDARVDALESGNPKCRVSKSGSQTIPINTGTALTWDVESWDVGPCHSGSSSQLIAAKDGIYEGVLYVVWDTDTRGFRTVLIRANGSTDIAAFKVEAEGSGPQLMAIPYEIFLSAGDYIQALAYYESSTGDPTTLDVIGASLTFRWVGTTA